MKNLIAITACGIIGVIALAFVIKTTVYMIQGRPIARVTGIRFVLLHDTMILLAALIAIGLYVGYSILTDRRLFRLKQLK